MQICFTTSRILSSIDIRLFIYMYNIVARLFGIFNHMYISNEFYLINKCLIYLLGIKRYFFLIFHFHW